MYIERFPLHFLKLGSKRLRKTLLYAVENTIIKRSSILILDNGSNYPQEVDFPQFLISVSNTGEGS